MKRCQPPKHIGSTSSVHHEPAVDSPVPLPNPSLCPSSATHTQTARNEPDTKILKTTSSARATRPACSLLACHHSFNPHYTTCTFIRCQNTGVSQTNNDVVQSQTQKWATWSEKRIASSTVVNSCHTPSSAAPPFLHT